MKTIAELQQEIRDIRKELKLLDNRLDAMDKELLNYKDITSDKSEYKRIYEIAKTMPIISHPVIKENVAVKNNYFAILLMVATVDDSLSDEQLLFLQRMVLSDLNNSRLDYYLGSLGTIHRENVIYKMNEVVKTKLSEQLLLDMMILANLSHSTSRESYEIIANIATLLNKDKQSLSDIAKTASAVLRQNITDLVSGCEQIIYMNEQFGYYLSKIDGWEECVANANAFKYPKITISAEFFPEEEEYWSKWY